MDVSFNPIKYNNYLKTNQNVCFKGAQNNNLKDVDDDIFFVNMNAYGTNRIWAAKMNVLMHRLSDMVSQNEDFESILMEAEDGINEINGFTYGLKRTQGDFFCIQEGRRGEEYRKKYEDIISNAPNQVFSPKSNEEYKDAITCKIAENKQTGFEGIKVVYGFEPFNRSSNLELAALAYDKLKSIENPTLEDINKCCATINWLIVQECPYCKGNDSLASVLTKAIYHAYNIQPQALKTGKSLDFEAFYSNLDDYIKNYPDLFKERPDFKVK